MNASIRALGAFKRLIATTTACAGLVLASLLPTPPAGAINPPQTTYSGVVEILGGTYDYSIGNFWAATVPSWGYSYTNPTLRYYTSPVATSCGTLPINNSYWCSSDWTIWQDYSWNQGLVDQYGDFGAGGVLAHEWGHAVDTMTSTRAGDHRDEYHADCMAGLYYRYGYTGGRLLADDYNEFYSWLYYQPTSDTHGSGPYRAVWFEYGYTQYTKAACDSVYRPTSRRTASAGSGASDTPVGTSSGPSVRGIATLRRGAPAGAREVVPGQLPSLHAELAQPAPTTALH